jgi:FdrA protein
MKTVIRSAVYYDSAFLMHLQRSLSLLPDILAAGVVMATVANKELLAQGGLLPPEAQVAQANDLLIVLRARDDAAAAAALGQVDDLLTRRLSPGEDRYRPKSLDTAAGMLPEAKWVLVSVPGRYAGGVSREALRLGKHVFLFSDNVSLEEEVALKRLAAGKGLFVMGPDCGTAIINGTGLGFANRARPGPIGLVAAAGTGLQQVSSRIHQFGSGLTHAIGTGGRDLSEAVGAVTTRQGLDLFRRDPATQVVVLVSKPPAPSVAQAVLQSARQVGKPVVVDFIGYPPPGRQVDNLHFVQTLDEAAEAAVRLAAEAQPSESVEVDVRGFADGQRYLRGLFSGGTLAYEALLLLGAYLPTVYSNTPLRKGEHALSNILASQDHTVIDLGEDQFTVGRPHPMLDHGLRIQRLLQEARDPQVAVIVLDVVLGHGAHPDPAAELAPVIHEVIATAREAGRRLDVVAVVVGTDADPQDLAKQVEVLQRAGAMAHPSNTTVMHYAGRLAQALALAAADAREAALPMVDLDAIRQPLAGINVGLESFVESLRAQGSAAVHVDWQPPAGGDERLMAILARLRE